MSKELVKLPKEVANAIEKIREIKATNWDIVYTFAWDTNNGYPELVAFAYSELDTLMQALVNGYEIEETPEDKVREYYTLHKDDLSNPNKYYINTAMCEAVIATLNFLNIKIEGVNA